jgi:hypothetical protein
LAITVLEKEKNESKYSIWPAGVQINRAPCQKFKRHVDPHISRKCGNVADVIDTYIEKMNEFKQFILDKNAEGIYDMIDQANKIKRII